MADPGQRLSEAFGSKDDCIVVSKGKGEESRHDFSYIYFQVEVKDALHHVDIFILRSLPLME